MSGSRAVVGGVVLALTVVIAFWMGLGEMTRSAGTRGNSEGPLARRLAATPSRAPTSTASPGAPITATLLPGMPTATYLTSRQDVLGYLAARLNGPESAHDYAIEEWYAVYAKNKHFDMLRSGLYEDVLSSGATVPPNLYPTATPGGPAYETGGEKAEWAVAIRTRPPLDVATFESLLQMGPPDSDTSSETFDTVWFMIDEIGNIQGGGVYNREWARWAPEDIEALPEVPFATATPSTP